MTDLVCGADGCPSGWLAVLMPPGQPARATATIVPRADALLGLGTPIAIDMPIGLIDTPDDPPRRADTAARAFLAAHNADRLRGTGSRVFATPSRAHLAYWTDGKDYAALRAAYPPPRSLSKQAWNICGKIAELDTLFAASPTAPLYESHPEVAFAHRAGRTLPPKKSPAGAEARRRFLTETGFPLESLTATLRAIPSARWAQDDLLDACILALTAARLAAGTAQALPDPGARDSHGRRCAIHY